MMPVLQRPKLPSIGGGGGLGEVWGVVLEGPAAIGRDPFVLVQVR